MPPTDKETAKEIIAEIEPILQRYPPDCRPTAVEPLGSAGGLSGARFWRLVAPRGTLALRCWPIEHPTPDGLRFIHAVLRHAADRGLKILPVPIATADGQATFIRHAGHLWELTPWLPGTADYEQSPRIEKLHAAMQALAQFHVAVADFPIMPPLVSSRAPAPAITHRLNRLRELQNGGIDLLTRAITDSTWPDLAPLARQFVAQLPHIVPLAITRLAPLANIPLPLQPCIRDVWHDHVLFDGNTVTGLIDFGATQIDTPATDIARLLGSLQSSRHAPHAAAGPESGMSLHSDQTWQAGLAAYNTIRPLSDPELLAIPALDIAGTILALCNWIRWIYVDGRKFDDRRKIIERVERLSTRLQYVSRQARLDAEMTTSSCESML